MDGDLLTNTDNRLRRFWHPVARADDLTAGQIRRVELLGEPLVVSRPTASDDVLVAADRCPHRAGRLSDGEIRDGCLACPYHGWRFDAAGRCRVIPALGADHAVPPTAHLAALATKVDLGLVWVCLDPEPAASTEQPDIDESLVWTWLPDVTVECQALQFIDNFCDTAHFPFVHAGTFGADEHEAIGELDVERVTPDVVVLRHDHTVANREDPLVETGEHPLIQPRRMAYRWTAPFTVTLAIDLPLTGVHNTIVAVAAPTGRTTTTLYTALVRNDIASADEPAARHAVDYEMSVLTEDLGILEHLADDAVSLDLPAQTHTRADRYSVEIRRSLASVLGSNV